MFVSHSMFVLLQKYQTYPFFWDKNIIKKLCYCNFCYQNHGCFGIEQIDDKGKCDKNTRYMDTKLCFKCSNQDVNAQRIFATCARN